MYASNLWVDHHDFGTGIEKPPSLILSVEFGVNKEKSRNAFDLDFWTCAEIIGVATWPHTRHCVIDLSRGRQVKLSNRCEVFRVSTEVLDYAGNQDSTNLLVTAEIPRFCA